MKLIKNKTIVHSLIPQAVTLKTFLITKCNVPEIILKENVNEKFLSLISNSLIYVPENEKYIIPQYNSHISSPAFSFDEVVFFFFFFIR